MMEHNDDNIIDIAAFNINAIITYASLVFNNNLNCVAKE